MGNSRHSESDTVTPWSPQELGLDSINLVVNEIFADFLTPDRLLFLHDLLLAHCLELHICNQVFANILCCENRFYKWGGSDILSISTFNHYSRILKIVAVILLQ